MDRNHAMMMVDEIIFGLTGERATDFSWGTVTSNADGFLVTLVDFENNEERYILDKTMHKPL